jgi:hypothetical protein
MNTDSVNLSELVFVCVADTLFSHRISGGHMSLGPKGVIAIKRAHAPAWLQRTFCQGLINCDDSDDDEIQELLKLIADGHAISIPAPKTFFMHINSKVTCALGFGENSSCKSDSEDDENDVGEKDSSDPDAKSKSMTDEENADTSVGSPQKKARSE